MMRAGVVGCATMLAACAVESEPEPVIDDRAPEVVIIDHADGREEVRVLSDAGPLRSTVR